jgi:chromosomal replication initiation ATPase DnaA
MLMSDSAPAPVSSPSQLSLPLRRDLPASATPFIVGEGNRAAVEALADWPNLVGGVMAISGPVGSGKSHLANQWAERVGAVVLRGAEAASADPLELENRPILLDDAEATDDETLFHLINLAQADGGALLMASCDPPASWSRALPDLASRLKAIPVATLSAPDDSVLSAILTARFAERSIVPGEGVIPYLVRRMDRSAGAAEALVAAIDARRQPVTRNLAREVFEALANGGDLFD